MMKFLGLLKLTYLVASWCFCNGKLTFSTLYDIYLYNSRKIFAFNQYDESLAAHKKSSAAHWWAAAHRLRNTALHNSPSLTLRMINFMILFVPNFSLPFFVWHGTNFPECFCWQKNMITCNHFIKDRISDNIIILLTFNTRKKLFTTVNNIFQF